MKTYKLSVLIPTYNCAGTIEATLRSISWANEILIVDSFSSDETVEICRKYDARIVQHEYEGPAKQKNWAIPLCTYNWVLQLDADEVLEKGFRLEIEQAIMKASPSISAFRIPRKNHILGQWVRFAGIYPDYQTRLFRKKRGCFEDREVHEHLKTEGTVQTLNTHILHYGMPSISKQLRNLDRYTRYEANEATKQGREFHFLEIMLRPTLVFLHRYVWLQGFRAGWRGFFLAAYVAMYTFWVQAKLWELRELELKQSPK